MSDPVNVVRLREATLEDDEFLVELVEMFLTDAADQLDLLASAVASPEQLDVGTKAHRLRGACSNIGADELARLCGELESQSESGAKIGPAVTKDIREEFGRVNTALLECMAEAKSRAA
jgi:HPt (histidine-containing phosphotransfer) domain-containing protein